MRDSAANVDGDFRHASALRGDSGTIHQLAATAIRVWQSRYPGVRHILRSIDGKSWVVCVTQVDGQILGGTLLLRAVRPTDITVQDALESHMAALVGHIAADSLNGVDFVIPEWEVRDMVWSVDYRKFLESVDSILLAFGDADSVRRPILVLAGSRGGVANLLGLMDSADVSGEVLQYDFAHSVAYVTREANGGWSLHEIGHVAVDRILASRVELNSRPYVALSEAVARAVGGSMGRSLEYYICDSIHHRPANPREHWRRPVSWFFSGRDGYNQLVDMLGFSIRRELDAGRRVDLPSTFRALTESASAEEIFSTVSSLPPSADSVGSVPANPPNAHWWQSVAASCETFVSR